MGKAAPQELGSVAVAGGLVLLALTGCADVRPLGPMQPEASWSVSGYERPGASSTDGSMRGSKHAPQLHRDKGLLATREVPPSPELSDGTVAATLPYQNEVPTLAPNARATQYAGLSDRACEKEVASLSLPATRATSSASGVASPMRLTGSMHGVRFVTPGKSSPFGVVDCRMVLALNDFAEALAAAGVVSVRVDNFYRPHAHLPGKKTRSQHASALASDIDTLQLADGRTLSVADDWHAAIGSTSCGPSAVLDDPTPEAIALRNIVCDVARRGLFHHMLTPSFNAEHRTHLHFDIKRGETHQSVR